MQGKGVVRFFLILMTLVTLAQFLLVIPTRRVEKSADAYASAAASAVPEEQKNFVFKEKRTAYLDSLSSETVFKVPLLKSYTYQDLKRQQIALGLDLKGGMSVLLQVDLKEFVKALANNSSDPDFVKALDAAVEDQKSSQSDFITLFADNFRQIGNGKPLAPIFARNEALGLNFGSDDGEVVRTIRARADETVDLTFKRLKERIDKLGVVQPNVSLDASRDLIVVELPGIDNPERARRLMQAAAKLEFWNVYRVSDPGIMEAFSSANERLAQTLEGQDLTQQILRIDTLAPLYTSEGDTIVQLDTIYSPVTGGPLFDVFTPNSSGSLGLAPMGTAKKNQRIRVDSLLNRPDIKGLFPSDIAFYWAKDPIKNIETNKVGTDYELYAIRKERGSDVAPLTGESVIDASANPDQNQNIAVSLKMNPDGARKWGDMTTKAAQDNNREIAILLDGEVVSAPRVINPITSGDSQITGSFSLEEAKDLANILQVGKLPAETRILQESLVGPSLGQENIDKSIRSLVIGFLLVVLFMVVYYMGGGVVAILGLFTNLFFIFGSLASLGTVLTLPGIAGIVLTMGMAVDSNVIIFERIREELRAGKALLTAIADGFKNSYSAIIDANVTTILVASILTYFGIGPIKGFGVVLIVGVLCSVFTAVLVGRVIIEWWTRRGGNIAFWNKLSENPLANINIDWMGKRKIGYFISGALTVFGIASFMIRGFDMGVDFTGGFSYNVTFEKSQSVDAETLRRALDASFVDASTVVKAVDTENTFNIVTSYLVDDQEEDAADRAMAKLHEGVQAAVKSDIVFEQFKQTDGLGTHVTSSSKVASNIADDIKRSAFFAGIFGLLAIFLYLLIRFSKWQFSMGAVAALLHDVIMVLGLYSLLHGLVPFTLEVDQAFVAAVLTVIGYSVNDTVIVFDRIREFMGLYTKKSKSEVLNMAINSTLSRTLLTSFTTLITVLVLFLFGGASIKGFAFALIIGIIAGTYSSIFIASALVHDLSPELKAKEVEGEKKTSFSKAAAKVK
ncbi:MAG: protein translocase subunit SecDF [Saprospiraceae bacterium]|nr:protein translocase subunit SecDF [Saprospiraceae bacterium]